MKRARGTLPKGYLFSAAAAAIKKPGRKDLALIFSEQEALMAGMFTTNRVKAAPVRLDMKRIRSGRGQAIIVNSGNANACTGAQGAKDAAELSESVAASRGLKPNMVYVCSTGVIGKPLPMERIRPKIAELSKGLGKSTIDDVAAAIMTTDSFPKLVLRAVRVAGATVRIAGICKGAGMICPNMATMLCFILSDAAITRRALDAALRDAVAGSFNRITVDGDRSTNDTVLLMANGLAGNDVIAERTGAFSIFSSALSSVAAELSAMIVRDGEGATKLVEIRVKNARSRGDADKAAFAVANSPLVKTAVYGNDANWGRIIAALGYSGIEMREERTDISIGGIMVARKGLDTGRDGEAAEVMRKGDVLITVDLHMGKAFAKVLTCDLTEDYIKINAEYRT
jgi:glutamate N-acetyltransferase/amino-acid N-acetyltransferase